MPEQIVLPRDESGGRCVQLYIRTLPVFVFEERLDHGGILEKTLREFDVQFDWNKIHGVQLPAPRGQEYDAVGMGMFRLFDRVITVEGSSMYYGLRPNQKHAAEIQVLIPDVRIVLKK